MKYYRVKKQFDAVEVWKQENGKNYFTFSAVLAANELYTPTEYKKLITGAKFRTAADEAWIFEPVEISRKKIYFFFGKRFAD